MNPESQRRLFGTAVLVALVVIFVPMLLPEPQPPAPPPQPLPQKIPAEPPQPQNLAPEPVFEPPPMPQASTLELSPPAQTPAPKPPPKPAPKPKSGWVIQVASFSSLDSAHQMVKKLRQAGFDTLDPKAVIVQGKRYYRVQVGPYLEKSYAKRLLPRVEKVSGTKGQVYHYP